MFKVIRSWQCPGCMVAFVPIVVPRLTIIIIIIIIIMMILIKIIIIIISIQLNLSARHVSRVIDDVICISLVTHLTYCSSSEGSFPSLFKTAQVLPLLK